MDEEKEEELDDEMRKGKPLYWGVFLIFSKNKKVDKYEEGLKGRRVG